jgi:hypothetical protein
MFLAGCGREASRPVALPAPNPTATPAPKPTATPIPTPTPVPTYGELNTQPFLDAFAEQLEIRVRTLRKSYWESIPEESVGSDTQFRNQSGVLIEGFIQSLEGDEMRVQNKEEVRSINLNLLHAATRFRFDPAFRRKVILLEARLKTFLEVSPAYRMEELDLTEAERLRTGDPDRLFAYAETTDPQTAFFLYGFLSREGRVDAKRELALMYLRGTAVNQNRAVFETMIEEAAKARDPEARKIHSNLKKFLAEEKRRERARSSTP